MKIANLIFLSFATLNSLGQIPFDIIEFKNGQTKKFTSDGSGKSQGLKFSIKYPQSYNAKEGDRPHIVQKFFNSNNDCDIVVLVMKLPAALSKKEQLEALSKSELMSMAPSTAKALNATDGLIIDGEVSGFLETYMVRKANAGNTNVTLRVYSRVYYILYKDYMIQVTFGIASTSLSESLLRQKFETYKILFSQVMNSFLILSKWG
jgi:hypothetical protein